MKKLYSSGKILFLMLLLSACASSVFAQTGLATLTGTVVDETNQPLTGVAVLVGTTGTSTDVNGNFRIENIQVGSRVTFQFIGLETNEQTFNGTSMKVVMKEDSKVMDDIIVTGFGSIKKSAYAGSASMVKTEGLADVPVANITSLLEGTAPGVYVSSAGGGPGGVNDIRIRGVGSYTASNSPLIVIDGVPVVSGTVGFTSDSNESGMDIMATINPNDVESMTVIKDAAAASLFGSRAANGVILIVTKSGKPGQAKITLKQDFGFTKFATNYREYLDGDQRRDFIYEGMIRRALYVDKKSQEDAILFANENIDKVAAKPWNGKWTDWEDIIFRTGTTANSEVSLSGATDNVNYYTSLGYTKQEGITKIQDLERYSVRLNIDYKARKNLTVGSKVTYSSTNQNYGYDNLSYISPIYSVYHKLTASDAPKNEDGTYNRSLQSNGRHNPLASMENDIRKRNVKRFIGSIYAELAIIPELKLRSTLSYDHTALIEYAYDHPNGSSSTGDNGSFTKRFRNAGMLVSNTNLNYVTEFEGGHHFDALVAYEVSAFDRDRLTGTIKNFMDPDKYQTDNGSVISSLGGYKEQDRLISYVSKVNYDYKGKYFAGVSYRMDGTSRLLKDNRWGSFWSASAAWRFTAEPFTEAVRNVITDGKLRFSYGANGNQATTETTSTKFYAGHNLLDIISYNNQSGLVAATPVSSSLVWETNLNMNVGIDLSFFNRINLTAEYYYRESQDLIMNSPVTLTSGASYYRTNIGTFRNTGFEFDITSRNIVKKDFTWTTSLNLSTNRNKVVNLDGDQTQITDGSHIHKIGHSFYNYYLPEFAGIDPANGKPVYFLNGPAADGEIYSKKQLYNEDGSLNTNVASYKPSDTNYIVTDKTSIPKLTGGLSNTFRYKMFDLSFLFTFHFGAWSEDAAMRKARAAGSGDGAINQIPKYYLNSWKQPGDNTSVEAWIYNNPDKYMATASTAHLRSTDHLRLKSLTFGVTIPKAWTSKIGIDKVRAYMSGSNLLTWAASDIYDPEVPVNGQVYYQTPPLKSLTFGIEVNF